MDRRRNLDFPGCLVNLPAGCEAARSSTLDKWCGALAGRWKGMEYKRGEIDGRETTKGL